MKRLLLFTICLLCASSVYAIDISRLEPACWWVGMKNPELQIISSSKEAGVCIVYAKEGRQIFVMGHFEYDSDTLKNEYFRDCEKGLNPEIPKNYFKDNDPTKEPISLWKAHSSLLYTNWINYLVYQLTPFEW